MKEHKLWLIALENLKYQVKENNLVSCSHESVAEILWTKDECSREDLADENCKIIIDNEKQQLATSFDGSSRGLIFGRCGSLLDHDYH